MSKKFEQLLDLVVNEDMDKANELFHEIVVEMSKEIYENMIAQEQDVDDMDESVEEAMDDEEVDEGMHGMDDMDEGMDDMEEGMHGMDDMEETMYDMDEAMAGGDPSDQFVDDTEDTSLQTAMSDEMEDDESSEIMDLKSQLNDIQNKIEQILDMEKDEPYHADDLADIEGEEDGEEEDEEEEDDEEYKKQMAMEQRRMTREYREKVTAGHGAERKGSAEEGSVNKHSPVSSAKGRPTSDANGKNLVQGGEETGKGGMGVLKKGGEFVPSGTQNVGSTKTKGYTNKVSAPSNKADHEKSLLGK